MRCVQGFKLMNKDLYVLKGKACLYLDNLICTSTNKQGNKEYAFTQSLNENI